MVLQVAGREVYPAEVEVVEMVWEETGAREQAGARMEEEAETRDHKGL
jgi:hypothetical protein